MREFKFFLRDWYLIFILGIAVIGFVMFVGISVCGQSQSDMQLETWCKYYASQEVAIRTRVRTILNDEGFANAGIGVTYSCNEDGECVMQIKIHHERLSEELLQNRIVDLAELISSDGMVEYQWSLVSD